MQFYPKEKIVVLMKGVVGFFLTLVAVNVVGVSAQTEDMTLERAIELGLQNNYDIRISKNDAAVARNNASLGNAGFLPAIDATASVSKSAFDTKQEFASGGTSERDGAETTAKQAAVALTWTLFDGFNMFTAKKQLNVLRDVGELNMQSQIENTVADIISAYNNILQQRQLLRALQDAINISRQRSDIAEGKFRIGSGSGLEWNRARVDLIADSSAYLRQDAINTNSKYDFNRLLARDGQTPFDIADSIQIRSDLLLEGLRSEMRGQNKDLQMAGKNLRLAKLRLNSVRSEFLPTVDFTTGYDISRTESNAGFFLFNRNDRFNYGLSARWNLFNGFNSRREAQNAKIDIRSSEIELQDIENLLDTELSKIYKRYEVSLQVVTLEEENEQLARQNVEIALEQFRLGAITSVDLREVQNTFLDSETRFLIAQLEAKLAETELLRLSGQLIR
jgi:outer membrane protein TolC